MSTSMSQDNNERLVRVEKDLEALKASSQKIETKVDAMYEAFVAARGAKWVVVTLWIGIGAMAANLKWLLQSIGVKFD